MKEKGGFNMTRKYVKHFYKKKDMYKAKEVDDLVFQFEVCSISMIVMFEIAFALCGLTTKL
jgi:hypothetical protein